MVNMWAGWIWSADIQGCTYRCNSWCLACGSAWCRAWHQWSHTEKASICLMLSTQGMRCSSQHKTSLHAQGAQQGPLPKKGSRALLHYTLITIVILISLGNTESTWRFSTEMCSEYSNLSAPQLWWWKCCLHWIKVPTPSLLIRWVSSATMQCILPFQCVLSGCTTLAPRFQTQLSEPPWTLRRNTGTFLVTKLSDVTWTPYLNTHATACN